MANYIQYWTADKVLNEPISSLEKLDINQRQTGKSLLISIVWFLSCGDHDNRYLAIKQISICQWNAFNANTKSHWEARATCLNLRPVPGLLEV